MQKRPCTYKGWGLAFLICTILFSHSGKAQKPYIPFYHYSSNDGLTQNQILSIFQDRQGFMWFGTLEGLNRFDGYDFIAYHPVPDDTTAISHDFVSYVTEDHDGTLWIGTGDGLNRYNRTTNTFTSYTHDPENNTSISKGLISEIVEDSLGNFWLSFATGYVDYFNRQKKEFIHFMINEDMVDVTSLMLARDGNLWVGSKAGITILDKGRHIVDRIKHNANNPGSLSNSTVRDIFQDDEGIIWIGTEAGLNKYDPVHHNFIHYVHNKKDPASLTLNVVKCLGQDKEHRLWVGTENGGLDIFDKKENKFYHFTLQESDPTGINDNSVYSIFKDRHENMWLGTNSSGINFYDRERKHFIVYKNIPGMPNSLSHNKVNAVAQQPGVGFWVATDGGGLNFFDEQKGEFKAYRHHEHDEESIPSDVVVDVLWDKDYNCLWVGLWGGGLARFDPASGKFKHFKHDENDDNTIAADNLWTLYQDTKGYLYIGTVGNGLSIFNKSTCTFENYGPANRLAEENVVSIFRDSKDFLWLGSWGSGLSRLNLKTKKFVSLPKGMTITSNESIAGDSLGRVWVTGNTGMQCYDVNNDRSFSLTTKDGLPPSTINAMLNDGGGNLWLSTNKGIAKYNRAEKKSLIFSVADGLPANQFCGRLLRADNGKMYFGSVNGLVVFHPDSIKQNSVIPAVVITDLKIFNKSVFAGQPDYILNQHISETKELWLPYEYNFISLSFVALSYTSARQNQYAYKLDGFDQDWVHVVNQRSATYTSLDPGDYIFKVKASNNDGRWNEKGVSLIIHVMPPWWQTYWFRVLVLGLVALAAFGFYYYRIRAMNLHNIELNNLVNERTHRLFELNKEVTSQNQVLIKNEEELAAKNDEISIQRDMLARQNNTLLARQQEIERQNEELRHSQEEISAQRDIVFTQNQELEIAQSIITKQNEAIKVRNENLEFEVALRTKELLEYNQQLEQFAFISAHNLRAPVARILGLGNVLSINPLTEEDTRFVYEKMIVTARELDRVVRDLNTILEIRKNNTAIVSEIDFDHELNLVKRYIEKEITDTNSTITADFSDAPTVQSVKPYVQSIIQNLITNAIKYRDPERTPVIQIRTHYIHEYLCLTVSDNGLGIDTELYNGKIFNLYQRFHTHVEGKGLGLYLIKTQILALGGKIELESKVNKGTTFNVYFKSGAQRV